MPWTIPASSQGIHESECESSAWEAPPPVGRRVSVTREKIRREKMPRASSRNGTPVPMDIDAKSDGSSVPSEKAQTTYAVGQPVEAKHMAQQVGSFAAKWYSGVVRKVHENGVCDVRFDDGDSEDKVPLKFLRLPRKAKAAAPVKEQQPAAASSAASDDDDEPDEPISQGRGKRKIVPTTCMVDGFAVKRQNMYDLDEGEGSVPQLWLRIVTGLASEQRAVASAGGFRGPGRSYARSIATSAALQGPMWPPVASRAVTSPPRPAPRVYREPRLHPSTRRCGIVSSARRMSPSPGRSARRGTHRASPSPPRVARRGRAWPAPRRRCAASRATSRQLAPPRRNPSQPLRPEDHSTVASSRRIGSRRMR